MAGQTTMGAAPAMLASAARRHQAGDLDGAESLYREVLEVSPGHAEALHRWGLIAYQRGTHEDAIERIGRAIAADPDNPRFHANLGLALHAAGRLPEAEASLNRALELEPGEPAHEFRLGNVLADLKLYGAAAQAFGRVLDAAPGHRAAALNRAVALRKARRFEESAAAYRAVIAIDSGDPGGHAGLGAVLGELGRYDEALAALDTALGRGLDGADAEAARLQRAAVLVALGRVDEGVAATHETVSRAPDYPDRVAAMARRHHQEGTPELALALLEPLLAEGCASPRAAAAFAAIASRFGRADEAIALAAPLLDHAVPADRRHLHFALGQLHDRQGNCDTAFSHFARANALYDASYDRAAAEAFVDRTIAVFDRDTMARLPRPDEESRLPLFIVGMPRSGTTLVEQILASHARVHGGEELFAIPETAAAMPSLFGAGASYPECVAAVEGPHLALLARGYLDKLDAVGGGADRVTDKMPDNYKYLGLIALMFPGAPIVHCVRDPLDCGLSNFFQEFIIEQLPYAADLDDIGHAYRQYRRLMGHWRDTLRVPMFEAVYEDLVADQEGISRALLDYCGLDWDEACLRFHENRRRISTWSFDQVRRPLYAGSVGRSRPYRAHLGPLIAALEHGDG